MAMALQAVSADRNVCINHATDRSGWYRLNKLKKIEIILNFDGGGTAATMSKKWRDQSIIVIDMAIGGGEIRPRRDLEATCGAVSLPAAAVFEKWGGRAEENHRLRRVRP